MTTATATFCSPAFEGPASAGSSRERGAAAPLLVYFSSVSGNTARFVEKLGLKALRIPLHRREEPLEVDEPFVLVVPTYGGGNGEGAVPKQVIRFLNDERNRRWIRGVISTGNTNFGDAYCIAGDIISRKCRVPHLDRVELFGTPDDVNRVSDGLETWWKQQ
ncbi:class Ib ribonucleoside-diphosphate reductase assembly flavoprotein NrdI [Microbacterium suaedae]|uniref:class Ib ribonucleoside-diphosphate reductase assembly flavoprotein NrdI n=1 Tax=Microbacterium suaedae TaxID=2067813 RepID=UPI000DACA7FC|nr:class Ib ribonucleoside-diphosphate reductase assembly flavoprotein NrdI [Microbacterium suaedae]